MSRHRLLLAVTVCALATSAVAAFAFPQAGAAGGAAGATTARKPQAANRNSSAQSGAPTAKTNALAKPAVSGAPVAIFGPPAPAKPSAQAQPAVPAVPVPKVAYPLAAVSALTFSPDGKRLALGTFGQVVVYDTATWQPTVTFTRVVDAVRALAFTPDGKTLAVGCGLPARNGQTFLWDLSPSGAGRILVGQKDAVETIAFSKDGKQALIGADDNTVRWFQDRTSFQFHNLDEHNGRVQAVAFSPRNSWIFITGAADHLVKVWDPRNWHTVINFDQSESGIVGLAFQNNGDQFVGASLDGKLYWWGVGYDKKHDTFGGYLYRVEMAHPDGVYAMSMCADGSRFITCGADNTVGVWNAGGGRIRTFKEADQPLYAVALSPDGKLAAGGGRSGLLYLWDVETSKLLSIVAPPPLPAAKTAPTAPKPALKQVAHVAKRGAH